MAANKVQIFKPSMPFTTEIIGGFKTGKMICICGIPKNNSKRITINLQEKQENPCEIGFHFDIRMDYKGPAVVVRNSLLQGSWGREEKDMPVFPFKEREKFYIIIHAKPEKYIISVNNEPFAHYKFRRGTSETFNFLNINGDVKVKEVSYQ